MLSWSTMGTRHGSVNFSVFVFKRFRRGSSQQHNKTDIIFRLSIAVSFIMVVASGGDAEKRAYFTFENNLASRFAREESYGGGKTRILYLD